MTVYNRFIYNGESFLKNLFSFVKSFFFSSTFSGSWFLVSCVFSVWLIYVCNKKDRGEKALIILSFLFYLICVFCSAYGKILYKLNIGDEYETVVFFFAKPYNSIIVGVPYFLLGRYFAKKDIHLTKSNKFVGVLCFVLLLAEIFITYKFDLQEASDCYLMLLPCASFLFLWIKDIKMNLKFNPVVLRNASTIIFFSHFIFIFLLEIIEKLFLISITPLLRFPIVSILTLVLSFVLIELSKIKHFYWIKYLY